ncbi:proteasome adapter and scaffold protein ECM29 [Ixodes scapularis]|uniref:proteasome adapter and scaffold protein ECM29 n=1 Tax=Ixodes scapularis TaxID=6945 RepID=UPI001A9DE36E|nr:proteasome adapter and scaffold protein ECM29 [Ixodes scapularis]
MAEAQNDIVLLERVFLRIVTAETDEQFESILGKFLLPILLKLSSTQEGVRKKVMEVLVHVNKRLKSRPRVQLPVEPLLQQYKDPNSSSFVLNFSMIYLKLGFPRLDKARQAELLPDLLACVAGRPQQHQDSLIQLALAAIPHVTLPSSPEARASWLGLPEGSDTLALLRERLLDLLLLPYSGADPSMTGGTAPACLSNQSLARLLPEGPPTPEELEKAKLGALTFVASGVFPERSIVVHLLMAAADSRHSVASAAEMKLKALGSTVDWNDPTLVSRLFGLFLGTCAPKGQDLAAIPEDQRRSPANTRIRLKLFPSLLKSREAATQLPLALMVTFNALYSPNNTNVKLKGMALQFVQSMCLHNSEQQLSLVGRQLMTSLLALALPPEELDSKLRVLACAALGQLGRKLPHLASSDLSMLSALFEGLAKEEGEVRMALQEALSMLAPAFQAADSATQDLVLALVAANVESHNPAVRQAAVGYAATVFGILHVPSRYLLLLATGDSKEEIRKEALKALHPAEGDGPRYPPFPSMLEFIITKAQPGAAPSVHNRDRPFPGLPWNRVQYAEVLRYLRSCLRSGAGLPPADSETDLGREGAPKVLRYLRALLAGSSPLPGHYARLLVGFLPTAPDVSPLCALLELVAAEPKEFAPLLDNQKTALKNLLSLSKEQVRECAAQLVGFLVASRTGEAFLGDVDALCGDARSENLELKQGALLALGFTLARKYRHRNQDNVVDSPRMKAAVEVLCRQFLEASKLPLGAGLLSCCIALGEVGCVATPPFPVGDSEADTPPEDPGLTLLALVRALGTVLHNAKAPAKVREEAARTLGLLCLGQNHFPHARTVLNSLVESSMESPDMEVHFTVGEAICCALLGPTSPLSRDAWATEEEDFVPLPSSCANLEEMAWLVPEILDKFLCNPKPSVRQAACIWTLSLLKRCSHQQPVLDNLKRIQNALLNLLADRSDMTQSIASKGLSLLYELSDEESRGELVSLLLETLTSGRRSTVAVTQDTRLFDEGTLGSAPTGGGLTTYRELCSLATDLNQPDLMYKFMHLANHHAMWNSKKGAAFGFGSIAERAGEQLSERLGDIVPKLYRYRYDPNPGVRASFGSIWASLVKEPHKMVDKYMKEILQDIVQNLTSNEWRVRESSCLALADLLSGRRLDEVLDHVSALWSTLFRVRDDIKESVRKACDTALQALSRACIRTCDVQTGHSGERALEVILPCLAEGLSSPVAEVRQSSLSTLVQLSRGAGVLLRPQLPLLFGALLNALSELEPQVLNQISVRAGADVRDKLDAARVAATKSTPAMETINHCVQFVDASVLTALVPRLVEQAKSSVGLGTRAGCAHLAVALTHQCPLELQPHAGKLLRAFVHGLSDRNATVRRCCATAVGNLAKVAKESDVDRLMAKLRSWYMETDDEAVQWACAHTMQSVARHAPDVLRAHATAALPLAFFAKHAKPLEGKTEEESPAPLWDEVWVEFTAGTESGLKLYLSEVVGLIQQGLECPSWPLRAQAGVTACALAQTLGPFLDWAWTELLLTALLAALSGRTWAGKESLLKALSAVGVNCVATNGDSGDNLPMRSAFLNKVSEALVRECRKENPTYKEQAVLSLAQLVEKHELDYFAPLLEILEPQLRKAADRKRSSEDDDSEGRWDLESQLRFQSVGFEALGQAWPKDPITQEKYQARLCDLLLASFPASTWKVQLSILKALRKFLVRLSWLSPEKRTEYDSGLTSVTSGIVDVACQALDMTKYAALSSEALLLMKDLLEKIKAADVVWVLTPSSANKLKNSVATIAKKDNNLELKSLAQDLADLAMNTC